MNYESGLYSDCPAGCLEHEHCDSCGQGYEAVYHVPDWMWAKLHTRAPAGLLCPCCAVLLAYGAGMQLDRNGLLPALRAVRDHCLALATKEFECQVERVKQYTGKPEAGYEAGARGLAALFMGLIKNLDDAALLELAGVGQHRDRTSDGLRSMTDERLVSGQLSKESAEQVPAPASSQKYERWPVGEPKDYREGSTIAPPSGDPRVFPGLAAPASSWCSQCGQDLSARACGPTHALRANELAGAGNLAGTEPTPTQTPRGKAMSETAPASSLPRVEATAPSGRILFAANSLLDAHKERQAAEPAERPQFLFESPEGESSYAEGYTGNLDKFLRNLRADALLDAARDMEEWAKTDRPGWHAGWTEEQRQVVKWCAYRLKARAKDIGETQGVADDRPAGAPSELDIAYNRGLIEAVKIARSHKMLVPTASAIGEKGRVYQTAWDGACNRIADDIEAKVKL